MSPRRSSRARINPPPPPSAPKQTNSSNSSTSSGRAERSTRSQDKNGSPRRSHPPRSQSLDDAGASEPAKPPPRRTRSGHDEIKEAPPPVKGEDEDEEGDEEEVTRCVCGQTEYPGLPAPTTELLKPKDGGAPDASTLATEEVGNMFIQCDVCQVWQHGGCVGILDDESAPDEYFCEGCRRDLHKVGTAPNG